MALLRLAPVLALAACYSPQTRDCAVSCARASDCEAGLVCGADRLCASPEVAGTCARRDGGVPGPMGVDARDGHGMPDARPDARPPDAPTDARPDAREEVDLHLKVMGPGTVTLDGSASCRTDCRFQITINETATLSAVADEKQRFDSWTGAACAGQPATCTFTVTAAVDVNAKFVKMD